MLILRKTLALAAILTSFCTPTPHIRVRNFSKQDTCYAVEYSSGIGAFPTEAICGMVEGNKTGGFWLKSGQVREFEAIGLNGTRFNGAITPVLEDNQFKGCRNELNFLDPNLTYYDMSYSYGISDGTCGPADGTNNAGERHALMKANKGWRTLNQTTKDHLLTFPEYLRQGKNGSLDYINMTVDAFPTKAPDVVYFLQVTAGFEGYMGPGSVNGVEYMPGTIQNISVGVADRQVQHSPSDQFYVTSY